MSLEHSPDRISASSQRTGPLLRRDPDSVALHRPARGPVPPGALLALNEGEIIVVPAGAPDALVTGERPPRVGPVYRHPGGALAVPTGRVLVRFAEGTTAASQRAALDSAGYDLEQSLDYAPHSAWVRARSGAIADALAQIPRLAALPGMENVEPQLLMPAAQK